MDTVYPAIFLDRDDTLVRRAENQGDPNQVQLARGAAAAVASLRGLGYKIVVVTNQRGVAFGHFTEEDVAKVHDRINEMIKSSTGAAVDRFYFCPYDPEGRIEKYRRTHPWLKPGPGMLLQAAEDLQIDLERSWMIGDRSIDMHAGAAAGSRTILLKKDAKVPARGNKTEYPDGPDYVAPDLIAAVKIIAQQRAINSESYPPIAVPESKMPVADEAPVEMAGAVPTPRAPEPRIAPTSPAATDQMIEAAPTDQSDAESWPQAVMVKLGQILQELRNQRVVTKPFGLVKGLAVVLQMISVVCILGALLMAGADGGMMYFRWISGAVLMQLACIAILVFDRSC